MIGPTGDDRSDELTAVMVRTQGSSFLGLCSTRPPELDAPVSVPDSLVILPSLDDEGVPLRRFADRSSTERLS